MPKQLYSSQEVDIHVRSMAHSILHDYADSLPLFVALLRGAAPFASKLMFSLVRQSPDLHPEIDYMMVSTYGSERSAGMPEIVTGLAPSTVVSGRRVVILDDVLDKGITADFVTQHLLEHGAIDVKLAVLVDKQTERIKPVAADYACFESPDVWLVGMGMDGGSKEAYRWRSEIFEIS